MRPRTACTACRKRQRRCIVTNHESGTLACTFCIRNNNQCSLDPAFTSIGTSDDAQLPRQIPRSAPLPPDLSDADVHSSHPKNAAVVLPPLPVCIETASAYFIYIHDPSHNIFHRPSFMSDLTRGVVARPILLCVIALAARFSNHSFFSGTSPRVRGNTYAREAERQFDLHSISLVTVQTALLLGAFYGTEGDSLHENLYYSLACREACLLDIPSSMKDSPLNQELGVRLWWTLDMIDVWSSNAARLPRVLPVKHNVDLPTNEVDFLRMRKKDVSYQAPGITPQFEASASVLTQKISLNSLLSEIAQLNRALADEVLSYQDAQVTTENLTQRLEAWRQGLPDSLTNTPENLTTQTALGCGGAFVALHIGYYHFSQLLHYQSLHQSLTFDMATSPRFADTHGYAERCRASSTALCELIYAAQALPGAEVYYSMVGHALVVSSTVQLHILLFSDNNSEVDGARQRLERNFLILCGLQNLWRTIDHSFGRFREFHEACMRAKANFDNPSNTFRLDRWMIGFLMEFSKPVEQRVEEMDTSTDENRSLQDSGLEDETFGDIQEDMRRWTMEELGIDFELDQANNPMLGLETWQEGELL